MDFDLLTGFTLSRNVRGFFTAVFVEFETGLWYMNSENLSNEIKLLVNTILNDNLLIFFSNNKFYLKKI